MSELTYCPECRSERLDFDEVCPACGAPPKDNQRENEGEVRQADLEPYVALRYIARLFKILAALMVVMLAGEVITGIATAGRGAVITLLGEATRMIVLAGFLWGGGDITILLIDAGHDLRVTRILLGRINARMHRHMGPAEEKPFALPAEPER